MHAMCDVNAAPVSPSANSPTGHSSPTTIMLSAPGTNLPTVDTLSRTLCAVIYAYAEHCAEIETQIALSHYRTQVVACLQEVARRARGRAATHPGQQNSGDTEKMTAAVA